MNLATNIISSVSQWSARRQPLNKVKSILWKIVRAVLVLGICYIVLYPLMAKVSSAFKDRQDVFDASVVWIPRNVTLDNFKDAFRLLEYKQAFFNSLMLSVASAILQTLSCALAGYGFAKLKFRGSNILFALVVFTIVIPPQTIMIPTYLHYRFFDVFGIYKFFTGKKGIDLLGSLWPFILSSSTGMGMKSGLYIFIFRQFFRGLPKELEEAAYVDGTGIFGTFVRVMLPNALTAMVTVFLFAFVWQWNDSYYANLYLGGSARVLSAQLAYLPGNITRITREPSHTSLIINAGMLLVIAPVFGLYLFAQKYFVESVERTGVVG